MLDRGVRQLQHVPGDRHDVPRDVPGAGPPQDVLVLSFGYIILRDPFSARNVAGILIAILGMGLYSYYSVAESRKKTEAAISLPVAAQVTLAERVGHIVKFRLRNCKKKFGRDSLGMTVAWMSCCR